MQEKNQNKVWSAAQWRALAERSYSIKECDLFKGTPLEAIRQAQNELIPPDMRRKITGMNVVSKIPPLWDELAAQGYSKIAGQFAPVDASAPLASALEALSTADLLREVARRLDSVADEDKLRAMIRAEVDAKFAQFFAEGKADPAALANARLQ
ncbi:hypothetical protein G3N59_05585 [Paraburkholderia sp. Ac-20340]|uniref:hypothetical protein n=1 Tax=Paraburkholderia sp. Ac-20340 TaxID=2703888 RepID=UPI0019805448|nr:hypothetical protein [Paraburkholderia sp. Ac-20340]MBN3852847.1 hypothetical protein [Paraburkholderia sp. Ac-20340]